MPLQPDGSIIPGDGCQVPGPTAVRDCLRQSAVDIMALVQNIKATGLGVQLDPTRVFLVGQSLGSFVGSLAHAVEPGIKAAVINVGGDSTVDTARLAYGDTSDLLYLLLYNPALLAIPGPAVDSPIIRFYYPYRDRVSQTTTPGVADIQRAFEVADWLNIPGAPLAYAPHFKLKPYLTFPRSRRCSSSDGAISKRRIQWRRISCAPTPARRNRRTRSCLRSSSASIWPWRWIRTSPTCSWKARTYSILPHRYLANPSIVEPENADELFIMLEVQRQVARFFKSGTTLVSPPFFQNLSLATLPNSRNFTWPIQVAPTP